MKLAPVLALALALALAGAARADEAVRTESTRIEPLTVTARRWAEALEDVPGSMTVLDERTLRDAGIRSVREAAALVPNMVLTEFSSRRLSFPTVRGVSTGVGDPSVTTYVDDVPQLSIGSSNPALFDLERIEILRGPQGTVYGRNSIGGVIKLESRRPGDALALDAASTLGDYALQEHSLSVSGPVVEEHLGVGFAGLFSERDGYTVNGVTGHSVDDRRSLSGRATVDVALGRHDEIEVTLWGERARDGGFVLAPLEVIETTPHRIAIDFEGRADRDVGSAALTWRHAAQRFELTSVSALNDWEVTEDSDFDFSAFDAVRRHTEESERYLYQELRLTSPEDGALRLGESADLRWLLGGTVFHSDGEQAATNSFRAFAPPPFAAGDSTRDAGDLEELGLAVFGQATLGLLERVDATAGLRYDHEDREARIEQASVIGGFPLPVARRSEDASFDEWVPTFSLAVHASDDVMLYGHAARGFKAGGFNLAAPEGKGTYRPETSWSYEVGVKSGWADGRLEVDAALFHVDWSDLQLSLFDAASGGFIDNAGEATSEGFEVELRARPTEALQAFASFGYTDARFDSFVDPYGVDVAGNDLPFVPERTWMLGAQYNGRLGPELRWFLRGEVVDHGRYALDAGNRRAESFRLVSSRLGVEWRGLRAEGWVRNLFDERYVIVALQPDPSDPSRFVGENGAPRTVGVTLSYRL